MSLNLGHLAAFHAVAEEGSVSRGAERLLVSQPAVSKQVRLLERKVGAELLERFPRGVRLTRAGELLNGYARRIFALEEEAVRALEELRGVRRGRLAIGASTTIGVYLLPPLFVQFRQAYPAIETMLEVEPSRTVEQRVADGVLDVGFVESLSGMDALEATQFASDRLVTIVAARHPLARKRRVSPEAFCREPFIVRATGSDTRSFVERELSARGLKVNAAMSLATTEAIKRAVAAGIGVALVSHLSVSLEVNARNLAVVSIPGLTIERPLYRVIRRGTRIGAALAAFLESMTR